jgi:dTDP-4-dehydrorhamnose reductase
MFPETPRIRDIRTAEAGDAAPRPRYSVLDCSKAASYGVTLRLWPDALADYVGELARSGRKTA